MTPPVEFGELSSSKLAALVFEIASQLHVERARRLALEAALRAQGLLSEADLEKVANDPAYCRRSGEAADDAVRRLLRVLSESPDEKAPLRGEAPAPERGDT
ncbi:MAG: hypothetical protein HIU85_07090 [Proteobacteria bacterium]|nr:hypothetical protein [Pseudomonadota bacterium]